MPRKLLSFLKQAPWLLSFWGLVAFCHYVLLASWDKSVNALVRYDNSYLFNPIDTRLQLYSLLLLPAFLLVSCTLITYLNVRLNGFSPLFLYFLPSVHYWITFERIDFNLGLIQVEDYAYYARTMVDGICLDFLFFSQLILVALGAALLAQHHRDRKLQQKEVLARD